MTSKTFDWRLAAFMSEAAWAIPPVPSTIFKPELHTDKKTLQSVSTSSLVSGCTLIHVHACKQCGHAVPPCHLPSIFVTHHDQVHHAQTTALLQPCDCHRLPCAAPQLAAEPPAVWLPRPPAPWQLIAGARVHCLQHNSVAMLRGLIWTRLRFGCLAHHRNELQQKMTGGGHSTPAASAGAGGRATGAAAEKLGAAMASSPGNIARTNAGVLSGRRPVMRGYTSSRK